MTDTNSEEAAYQAEKREEISERQDRAYRLLLIYQKGGGDDDKLTAIGDLITDLLHLGDQYGMIDVDWLTERSVGHYNSERFEAGIED